MQYSVEQLGLLCLQKKFSLTSHLQLRRILTNIFSGIVVKEPCSKEYLILVFMDRCGHLFD